MDLNPVYFFLALLLHCPGGKCFQIYEACPDGWIYSINRCYKFVSDRMVTWSQADEECQRYDAGLLRIKYRDELAFIKSQLSALPFSPNGFWTGLADRDQEGLWHFEGQGTLFDQSLVDWGGGPNNSSVDSDCGYVIYNAYVSIATSGSTLGYICVRPAVSGQAAGAHPHFLMHTAMNVLSFVYVLLLHDKHVP